MADIKRDFQKVIGAIRKEGGKQFPKAMLTGQQAAKNTATVNCGGEWYSLESTEKIAAAVMSDKRFTDFLEKHNATAQVELNPFGAQQIRINY